MAIEFLPWYQPDSPLLVCSACGTVVRDTETHLMWHEAMALTIDAIVDRL